MQMKITTLNGEKGWFIKDAYKKELDALLKPILAKENVERIVK